MMTLQRWIAAALLAACACGTSAQTAAPPAPEPVTATELDKAAYAFADRYTTQLVAAADAVVRDNPSSEQRRMAHLVKLVSVSGIYDIVTNAEPVDKLMDLLMVVTLQSYRWIDEDMADKTFGNRSGPLIQAMRTLRVDIWNVASRVLRPEQLQQLDALILEWRKRNPHVDILSYLRFDEVAGQRRLSAVEEIKASGLFAEIASATKVADDARLLAERAFYQAKRLPFLMNWQMESLVNETLAKPEVVQSLQAAEALTRSADRATQTIEKLPQVVASEREALVATLEDRNGRLAKLMGEFRSTALAVDQVAQKGERLSLHLRDTAHGLTETSNAVNQLLTKHSSPPDPAAKPFEIEPYITASAQVRETVAGINTLLGQTDTLMQKKPWAAPLQDANALLAAQIDAVFWRALALLGAFFAMLFAYRLAVRRWAAPAA